MARGRRSSFNDDEQQNQQEVANPTKRPGSVEEAARPQNKDYKPRYEDGSEKPQWKWTNLEQEMYEANTMNPEAIRLSTSHLGPSAKVGLDPRGPLSGNIDETETESGEPVPGSSDARVPTGKPGFEKLEEQNQDAEAAILAVKY
jgi:hypothetical protein